MLCGHVRSCDSERLGTHFQDGAEGCGCDVGADGGKDGLADLSDVSALLREQRQQYVHHHLHPLRLCLFLLSGYAESREAKKTFAFRGNNFLSSRSKVSLFFYETFLLLFLLGFLLMCFVHAALQVLQDVQQLFRGLQDQTNKTITETFCPMALVLFAFRSTLTLKRCMPTNRKSCWNAVFSAVAPFLDFFFRFDTDSIILGRD